MSSAAPCATTVGVAVTTPVPTTEADAWTTTVGAAETTPAPTQSLTAAEMEPIAPSRITLVPGNHDFADLAMLLRRDGVNAQEVTPEGVDFQGVRFAGFGHIPFIEGRWNREVFVPELRDLSHRTLTVGDPDVLLTHAPPGHILGGSHPGNGPLLTALTHLPHRVRVHLFGHIHETGGRLVEHMGIRFYNSATTVQVLDV